MSQAIVIVRHGETEWSLSGQHTSRTDLPLTSHGAELAAELGPRLEEERYELVLTSPLLRARQTCELAGFQAQAEVDERLREWDYGDYEGLTTPQIRQDRPGWNLWQDGCPQGETAEEVGARVDGVLKRLSAVPGETLLFAHGHVLRVLTARWLQLPPSAGARFRLEPGALGRLGYERETQVLLGWNID